MVLVSFSEPSRELMQRLFFIAVIIFSWSIWSTSAFSEFNPLQCEEKLFGGSHNNFLEPYWAQWRVGSHLVEYLLTEEERNNSIKVGVYDTSIEENNPVFVGVLKKYDKSDFDFLLSVVNHGSLVSGLLTSKDRCSVGLVDNNDLFFYQFGPQTKNLNYAIQEAIAQGAKVFNFSASYYDMLDLTPNLLKEIKIGSENDLFFTWSAGNDGKDYKKQFDVPPQNIYISSALNPVLQISDFSNRGSAVIFSAPGERYLKSFDGNNFWGTSASAPIIGGAALNIYKVNPSFTAKDVEVILKMTAFDLGQTGRDSEYGWGMPNIPKAIRYAQYLKQRQVQHPSSLSESELGSTLNSLEKPTKRLYSDVIVGSKNCSDYGKGINSLFLYYFMTGDSSEICNFYAKHNVLISQVLYCQGTEHLIPVLLNKIENPKFDTDTGIAIDALKSLNFSFYDWFKKLYEKSDTRQLALDNISKINRKEINDYFFKKLEEDPGLIEAKPYIYAVASIDDERSSRLMLNKVENSSNKDQRHEAINDLVHLARPTEDVIKLFKKILREAQKGEHRDTWSHIYIIMNAIKKWDDPQFISSLTPFLNDHSLNVQLEASETLSSLGAKEGFKKSLEIAQDDNIEKSYRRRATSCVFGYLSLFLQDDEIGPKVLAALPVLRRLQEDK